MVLGAQRSLNHKKEKFSRPPSGGISFIKTHLLKWPRRGPGQRGREHRKPQDFVLLGSLRCCGHRLVSIPTAKRVLDATWWCGHRACFLGRVLGMRPLHEDSPSRGPCQNSLSRQHVRLSRAQVHLPSEAGIAGDGEMDSGPSGHQ